MKRKLHMFVLGAAVLLMSGCAQGASSLSVGSHEPVVLSAWIASWDEEKGLKEYGDIKNRLVGVSCFMAYYDQEDKLFIPEETRKIAALVKEEKQEQRYISFTNDWKNEQGKVINKDTELLRRLFADDKHKEQTIAEMLQVAKELQCTGIELDYESFFKDSDLLQKYLSFTYKLSSACIKEGLSLRIVLEPGMPMDVGLCRGPEYVVMFYNLHGRHNGPGPKADSEFIAKTIKKMEAIPGKKAAAFATGGCLWEDYGLLGLQHGKIRFLDEDEAVELAKAHQVTPERDEASYAMHFTYKEAGHDYELWYADNKTLQAWIKAAADGGIKRVSLWRLGGNYRIKEFHAN
ncbi:hypothetical protein [uncultured Anaerovibrio sp.]|uniref:hypothetical protein n=1 Tax=uncultured Anaerovibrio sp. TaxID=361586 RepID=UPI002620CA96|nr:hypothetical protein [uncultured Anaerovibrio sp.]